MPQGYHQRPHGATESLWLKRQHGYNHPRFTRPAPPGRSRHLSEGRCSKL